MELEAKEREIAEREQLSVYDIPKSRDTLENENRENES